MWRKCPFSILSQFLTAHSHLGWREVTKILLPLWGTLQPNNVRGQTKHRPGNQILHPIVGEEINNYCFSETHRAIVAPQDTLYDGKALVTTGIHATVGLCLIKDDCRKNNYKRGCSPNPTDGSTSSFPRVRDRPDKHHQPQGYQKWREQEKGGKDEDIASWTKRDSKAVRSGRGDSWVKQHHSWHHSGRAGWETAELAKQAPRRL